MMKLNQNKVLSQLGLVIVIRQDCWFLFNHLKTEAINLKIFLCNWIAKLGRFDVKNFLLHKMTHLVSEKLSSSYTSEIENFEKNRNSMGKVLGIQQYPTPNVLTPDLCDLWHRLDLLRNIYIYMKVDSVCLILCQL